MNRLNTATLTVLTLLVPTLLAVPMLAQAPADSANFEVGNQVLISSHDRIEIQERLLYAYAETTVVCLEMKPVGATPMTRKIV